MMTLDIIMTLNIIACLLNSINIPDYGKRFPNVHFLFDAVKNTAIPFIKFSRPFVIFKNPYNNRVIIQYYLPGIYQSQASPSVVRLNKQYSTQPDWSEMFF